MEFRRATREDITVLIKMRIEFLKEIEQKEYEPMESRLTVELDKYFSDHIQSGDFIGWFALDEKFIIATGGVCFNSYLPSFGALSEKRAYIMNIYTLPEYRKRGVAKRIFEQLMKEAASKNVCMISLHATADGRDMYEKFGFKSKGNEMVKNISKYD